MIYHGSVCFYHCKLFNCIILFCQVVSIVHHIMSYIYLTMLHHLMHLHHVHPPSLRVSFQFPKGIPHVSIRSLTFFSIWMRRVKAMTCGKLPWRHRRNDKGHSVEAKDGRLEFEFQHPINLGFWRGGEPGYFWESCLEGHDASWVSTDCQRVWGQHLSIENLKDESNGNLIKSRFEHEKTSTSGRICRGNVCLKMSSYPMGVLVRPDKTSWRRLSCPKNIGWSWCFGWIFWSSHHDVDDFHSLTYLIDIFP